MRDLKTNKQTNINQPKKNPNQTTKKALLLSCLCCDKSLVALVGYWKSK